MTCKGQTQSAIYVADGVLADTAVTAFKTTNNPWGRGVLGIAVDGAAAVVNCLVTQCRVVIESATGAGGLCLATDATGAGVTNLTVYANACSSATDLRGAPRATASHRVDIGCCQAASRPCLTLIVR